MCVFITDLKAVVYSCRA